MQSGMVAVKMQLPFWALCCKPRCAWQPAHCCLEQNMLSWSSKWLHIVNLLSAAGTCLLLRSRNPSAALLSNVEGTEPPAGISVGPCASTEGSASAVLKGWSGAATGLAMGCRDQGREQSGKVLC